MRKIYVENNKVVIEVDGAKIKHSIETIHRMVNNLSQDLETWKEYERLLTQRAPDGYAACRHGVVNITRCAICAGVVE